ncbi:MAG: FAD:protein FMN transferase [Solirubrobacteraceae bacterium]
MSTEVIARFPCFGGHCVVMVGGTGPAGRPADAVLRAKRRLLGWHGQFSRFDDGSELSRLNADRRGTVPVSAAMIRFVAAAIEAAELTGGLVDPTLVTEIERAGYVDSLPDTSVASLSTQRALAPTATRSPAGPSPTAAWRQIKVDHEAEAITRPPGVRLDSGGIAKGMFADMLAAELAGHDSFAVTLAGDLRFGTTGSERRPVQVADPFDDSLLHVFELVRGAAATSAITKRSWRAADGSHAHHLIDPATGRPAFTGVVQVTALAPTAAEAEARSKAALLSGPSAAATWLTHGGLVVRDDASIELIEAPAERVEAEREPMAVSR